MKNWKELKKQFWAKLIAMLLAIVSGFVFVVTAAATVLYGTVSELQANQNTVEKDIDIQLLENYATHLFAEGVTGSDGLEEAEFDGLDGGHIAYTVVKKQDGEKDIVLYTNDASVDADSCMVHREFDTNTRYVLSGQEDSFLGMLLGSYNTYDDSSWWMTSLDHIVYNQEDGLFYADADGDGAYFLMTSFDHVINGRKNGVDTDISSEGTDGTYGIDGVESVSYEYKDVSGAPGYYADGDGKKLEQEEISSWNMKNDLLRFDSGFASKDEDYAQKNGFLTVQTKKSLPKDKINIAGAYSIGSDLNFEYDEYSLNNVETTSYDIYMTAKDTSSTRTLLKNGLVDYFGQGKKLAAFICNFRHTSGWWAAGSALLCLLCFVFLMSAAGRRPKDDEVHMRWIDRVPFGIITGGCCALVTCGVLCIFGMIGYAFDRYITISLTLGLGTLFAAACEFLVIGYFMSIAVRVKTQNFWRYTILHYLIAPFRWAGDAADKKQPTMKKVTVLFAVGSLIELWLLAMMADGDVVMLCIIIKLVEYLVLRYYVSAMLRIRAGGMRIANGDYSQPINTEHMPRGFREHAENINHVGEGISKAVDARMKSEHFKTELITNVSHDIKTPLTSIINYVDLMKKEKVDNETVQEYIAVLDRQSARLKKLIEDLMEASKASTGNIKVELEAMDATVMLTQVVGEFEERAKKNQLDIVVDSPEPPVKIMADGRHLWRVIDNLMSNICKYAMPGTRVYISLEKFNGMVIMTFRNISRSQLNISSEELMERFVRGDSSRNTEGSGLGLSIAQSLTGLMNGNFAIQIDGDLFKAILSFEEVF